MPRLVAPPGCLLEHKARVGSTNIEALMRARAGLREALWVVADEQTDGRGRHGRRWTSPPGNLYASRLVIGAPPLGRFAGLSFVASLATYEAAKALLPAMAGRALWLKWPNDLMVGQGKVAGVLIETETVGEVVAVAVGIGLNLTSSQEVPDSISLAALGREVSQAGAFDALSRAFEFRLAQWDDGRGFAAIRAQWTSHTSQLGAAARVRLEGGPVEGTFGGIDETGALILRQRDGTVRVISAGEVTIDGVRA